VFLLCTTEPHKIPLTIHSRCQRFHINAISTDEIREKLHEIVKKENIAAEEEALWQIATFAEGGMRDALSLLDQALSYSPEMIRVEDILQISGGISHQKQFDLAVAIRQMDAAKAMKTLDELIVAGKEVPKIMGNLLRFYRDMLVYKNVGFLDDMSGLLKTEAFEKLAKAHSNKRLFFYVDILSKALNDIKWSNNPRLYLELAIIKLTDDEPASEAKLIAELARLEERIGELEKAPNASPSPTPSAPAEKPSVAPAVVKSDPVPVRVEPETKPVVANPSAQPAAQDAPQPSEPSLFSGLFESPKREAAPAEDLTRTYDPAFIEAVLNNGDRADKTYLTNLWPNIAKANTAPAVQATAALLAGGVLAASSKDKIIVTFSSAGVCNRLMRPQERSLVKTILKNAFRRDIDAMMLPADVFQTLSAEFIERWRAGERNIRLSPIVCPELRDVSRETDEEQKAEERTAISEAIRLFGDLVNVKKSS
jgi:DNA polymerase-3 subunit gamma/tau